MEQETWKDIRGFEGLYQVSDLGKIKSLSRVIEYKAFGKYTKKRAIPEKILKNSKIRGAYEKVRLIKRINFKKVEEGFLVSRLVAEYFVPKEFNYQNIVQHKNGDKTDSRAENLRWHYHKGRKTKKI